MHVRTFLATTAATAAVGLLPMSAKAAILFSTSGITVTQPTPVRFTLVSAGQPQQFFLSNLNVYVINPSSGFVDPTSAQPLFRENPPAGQSASPIGSSNDFTFLPGFTYALGLTNFNPSNLNSPSPFSPYVFSANQSNQFNAGNSIQSQFPVGSPNTLQQRVIFGYNGPFIEGTSFTTASGGLPPADFASLNNPSGSFLISFEDGGINPALGVTTPDLDFNDFQVKAEVIPAPPLLLGLLAMGARVISRQRKAAKA